MRTLLAICYSLTLMSCGNIELGDAAKKIEQVTGLPVVVNAEEHDECVIKQLRQMSVQLKFMKKEQRSNMIERVKSNFEKLSIEKTNVARKTAGEIKYLVFFSFQCTDDNCWYEESDRKMIEDGMERNGAEPKSRLRKNEKILALHTEASFENHNIIEYMTTNEGLYGQVEKFNSQIFRDAVGAKVVTVRRKIQKNNLECQTNNDIFSDIPEEPEGDEPEGDEPEGDEPEGDEPEGEE